MSFEPVYDEEARGYFAVGVMQYVADVVALKRDGPTTEVLTRMENFKDALLQVANHHSAKVDAHAMLKTLRRLGELFAFDQGHIGLENLDKITQGALANGKIQPFELIASQIGNTMYELIILSALQPSPADTLAEILADALSDSQ